ncbi:MAG: AmmeMemoRadiSam system protein B [Desulfobacteraceae bacterium]|nr:AmmeMemoRadiSam system protein B [Desulfobacteraceae bacterium]
MPDNEFPKLRNGLEALPVEHDGKKMFLLRDRIGYATDQLVFSPPVICLLSRMDGGASLRDLQAAFMQETGQMVYMEELQNLIQALDQHYFLDNSRFRNLAAREISGFLDNPVRKARHAGASYPDNPQELRELLGSFFLRENGGPGCPDSQAPKNGRVLGLVAPHIDLRAGGPCFAHAYKAAAEATYPDTWIVLGTGHDHLDNYFAITVKDFETPLGIIRCDQNICEELIRSTPFDIRASEYNHRVEHTIEFQAVFLSMVQPGAKIVPLLCSFGPEDWDSTRLAVDAFARTLSDIVFDKGRSVGIIASVDLAHVGPRYGDRPVARRGIVEEHLASDAALLSMLEDCRADDFMAAINRDGNSRKICGVAPLYTLARALDGMSRGTTLCHAHAPVDENGSFVTFASMAFFEREKSL